MSVDWINSVCPKCGAVNDHPRHVRKVHCGRCHEGFCVPDPTTEAIKSSTDELVRLRDHNLRLRKLVRSLVGGGVLSDEDRHWLGADEPDYTKMSSPEMVTACGDSAQRWADAFCQHANKLGIRQVHRVETGRSELWSIDVGWVIGWFANAIETAADIRVRRGTSKATPDPFAPAGAPCQACGSARIETYIIGRPYEEICLDCRKVRAKT